MLNFNKLFKHFICKKNYPLKKLSKILLRFKKKGKKKLTFCQKIIFLRQKDLKVK